jgi:hypothetical protein
MRICIFIYPFGKAQQCCERDEETAIVELLAALLPSLEDIVLISLSGSGTLQDLRLAEPLAKHRYESFEVRIGKRFWGTLDIG